MNSIKLRRYSTPHVLSILLHLFLAFTGSFLCVIAQWMMSLASKTAPCGDTTVMESISLNRLTSTTPHPQRKARTKRQVSDFQKRLKTEPQRPAEPNDISNQKLKELSKLHFHFYVCLVCMTHNTRWLSCRAKCKCHRRNI